MEHQSENPSPRSLIKARKESLQWPIASLGVLLQFTLLGVWWSVPPALPPLHGHLLIDINQASAEELSILPRIGPVLARRIVENRTRLGNFADVWELDRVPGIGRHTVGQIQPYCVTGSSFPAGNR